MYYRQTIAYSEMKNRTLTDREFLYYCGSSAKTKMVSKFQMEAKCILCVQNLDMKEQCSSRCWTPEQCSHLTGWCPFPLGA